MVFPQGTWSYDPGYSDLLLLGDFKSLCNQEIDNLVYFSFLLGWSYKEFEVDSQKSSDIKNQKYCYPFAIPSWGGNKKTN